MKLHSKMDDQMMIVIHIFRKANRIYRIKSKMTLKASRITLELHSEPPLTLSHIPPHTWAIYWQDQIPWHASGHQL